jgi:broad specificity phosphatase PhoE
MLLFCIRHGETEFNAAGRIQGQLDSPLSELGYRQCAAAADALVSVPIDAVYSSPLLRAAESARIIAERLNVEVRFDDRLKEINAGVFQGRCWAEIDEVYPDEAKRWRTQDPDFCIPQGESRRLLMTRAFAALSDIKAAGHQQVVVVAHGGSLSAAFKALLEIPAERNPFSLQNGSITRIAWGDGGVKMLSLNQIDHLHDLARGGGEL